MQEHNANTNAESEEDKLLSHLKPSYEDCVASWNKALQEGNLNPEDFGLAMYTCGYMFGIHTAKNNKGGKA